MRTAFNGIDYDCATAERLAGVWDAGFEEELFFSEATGYFLLIRKCQRYERGEWVDVPQEEDRAGKTPPVRFLKLIRPLSELRAAEWCLKRLVPEGLRNTVGRLKSA
jgi:hypothetical protein